MGALLREEAVGSYALNVMLEGFRHPPPIRFVDVTDGSEIVFDCGCVLLLTPPGAEMRTKCESFRSA